MRKGRFAEAKIIHCPAGIAQQCPERGMIKEQEAGMPKADARRKLGLWRYDYSNVRPHPSLGPPRTSALSWFVCKPLPTVVERLSRMRAPRPTRLPKPKPQIIKTSPPSIVMNEGR